MRTILLVIAACASSACALLTSLDDLRGGGGGGDASDGASSETAPANDAALEAEVDAPPPPCGAPGETCCKAPLAPCEDGLTCSANACMVSDAWAVGEYKTIANGFVTEIVTAHYDGTSWTLQPNVNVDTGLGSSDPVDIYQHDDQVSVIANENDVGSMYRWNTVSWALCKTGNACSGPNPSSTSLWALTSVVDNGSTEYWVAGTNLMDVCKSGSSCTPSATGITGSWGTGSFAGETSQDLWYSVFDHVLHFTGTSWSAMTVADARTIAEIGTNDVWVGDQQLRHYDGNAWTNAYLVDGSKTPGLITSIAGAASNDVLAIGSDYNNGDPSFAAHWDGTTWKMTSLPAGMSYAQKVWAPSRLEAFTVGAQTPLANTGMIAHWNGTTWSTMPSPTVTYTGESQPGSLTWISITGRARARRN